MVVGIVLIAGWFCYELVANQHLRWDLAAIGGTMAVTKILAMVYYRGTG